MNARKGIAMRGSALAASVCRGTTRSNYSNKFDAFGSGTSIMREQPKARRRRGFTLRSTGFEVAGFG